MTKMITLLICVLAIVQHSFIEGSQEWKQLPVCKQYGSEGYCTNDSYKYFYHAQTGLCSPLKWTGCGGNDNNFESLYECYRTCGGMAKHGRCESFTHSSCLGNANVFEEKNICQNTCIDGKEVQRPEMCSDPPDSGNCKGSFKRYYFDNDAEQCKTFTFGGCGGNTNNYKTKEECSGSCIDLTMVHDIYPLPRHENAICELSADAGECNGQFKKYFYNANWMECTSFSYGGCNGNSNRFNTLEECQKICPTPKKGPKGNQKKSDCQLPEEYGDCSTYIARYRYNKEIGYCQKFGYSGCGGNKNNFKNLRDCLSVCKPEFLTTTMKPQTIFKEAGKAI